MAQETSHNGATAGRTPSGGSETDRREVQKHVRGAGTYDRTEVFTDEKGQPVHRTIHTQAPHNCTEEHLTDGGQWVLGLEGVKRHLFALPRLLANPGAIIYYVEGAKDATTLNDLDFVATTHCGGVLRSSKDKRWRPSYTSTLEGRHVVVLADNDAEGVAGQEYVAQRLHGKAASVKCLVFPDEMQAKEDVTDWIQKYGHTAEDLEQLTEATPLYEPPAKPDPAQGLISPYVLTKDQALSLNTLSCDDGGQAERIVFLCHQELRWCEAWGWLRWNGSAWTERGGEQHAMRCAQKVARTVVAAAAHAPTKDAIGHLTEHGEKSTSTGRLSAALAQAQVLSPVFVEDADLFDADGEVLHFTNGNLDLRTFEFTEGHDRKSLHRLAVPHSYNEDATCEKWLAFLNLVLPDVELQGYVHKLLGYSVTADTAEQVFHLCVGAGANGKTTLLQTIRSVLGPYAATLPSKLFAGSTFQSDIDYSLAKLVGTRFVVAEELPGGRRLNESRLKQLSGGDQVDARHPYCKPFAFEPRCKIVLQSNDLPAVGDSSMGFWRKCRAVPFNVVIPKRQRILDYHNILVKEEGEGILQWLIHGLSAYRAARKAEGTGLAPPLAVEKFTEEYQEEEDVVKLFLAEHTQRRTGQWIQAKILYEKFIDFARDSGERYPIKATAFGRRLTALGYDKKHRDTGTTYENLQLKTWDPDAQGDQ